MARLGRAPIPWAQMLATVLLVGAATAIGLLARGYLASTDLVMLYIVVIVIAATRLGRVASVCAAALSVLAYDFCFVPPVFTFAVSDESHLLTFATMFGVGVLISALTARIRQNEADRARLAAAASAADLRARTEQMRSSLLSAVSHDLRTPLAAITGAATTLRDAQRDIGPDDRAELLDTICEEAERLERFVVNLLEMTRLQAGAVEVKREWVPLEELIGSALTRLGTAFDERTVRVDIAPDVPLVSVDPVLLEQVFFNLLDNAAKHTPSGSAVEIRARASDQSLIVEVADSGPGLPRGEELRIFEKFVRGPSPTVRGAGLGLAICRGIVDAHGGTIAATTREEGGALFTIQLPLLDSPPAVPVEAPLTSARPE